MEFVRQSIPGIDSKGEDARIEQEFQRKAHDNLALDHGDRLVYIAPTRVNLGLTEERWPEVRFLETCEY